MELLPPPGSFHLLFGGINFKGDTEMKKQRILNLCVWVLAFLSLVFLFSCKGSPTSPDIPQKNLPVINSFTASPAEISYLESSTLSWSVSNATTVEINQGIGTVESSGSKEVTPAETTVYKLTATNSDGQTTKECEVKVKKQAYFELVSYSYGYKSYGCCYIEGKVKNIGNATGYNVMITFSAYNASDTIIDTANGFPANLGNIPVGVSAVFDAVFFDTYDWNLIAKVTYEITWLTAEGVIKTQNGVMR